ncbi:ribosomal-protein-alanine N-acetyltransferase [Halorientalis persicus]|jgi:ribosomal-protein-alanine N-acetyltransferase|uniref:Ribosomal-protein-alanine N-acetyltransferase n=1 Tax=Halorientalis persicus TaxID=1367881 RepID=A0A1H8D0R6_9EURY|nr:GNAT family N-acetyltransferase [Halorientalis persicus]SEN00816.1 ribosomal-protein-alanine N-acetyltransferase [Halorientalis persicus]
MIRQARPADLARLRAIQMASLTEPWDGLLEPAIDGPPVVLVVADETDEPVGYAVAIPQDTVAYLAELAVAAGHRGEGRGSRLLAALCEQLEVDGFERLELTVRAGDDRARDFYDDHDFLERERLPDHYEDGDGLLLARPLQN